MARRIAFFAQVGVPAQRGVTDTGLGGQPAQGRRGNLMDARGIGRNIQLGAVAGGQNRRLGSGPLQPLAEILQNRAQLSWRKGQAPAQVQRSSLVVEPEGKDGHKWRIIKS